MKILLLCEAPMDKNAGGISQTLYNIFSFCEPENILCVSPHKEIANYPPSQPFQNRYIGYDFELLTPPANRIGKIAGSFIDWCNYTYNKARSFSTLKKQIRDFNPDVIISCPNTPVGVIMHHKLLDESEGKVLPYFMDDWVYGMKDRSNGKMINKAIAGMLMKSKCWLMIGKELADLYKERYNVKPSRVLHVHNPVDLTVISAAIDYKRNDPFVIAYAGALWPMHYDSFYAFAKAVHLVSSTINIKLCLYSPASFWDGHKNELAALNVTYGGHIPYANVNSTLGNADALLLTSSFSKDYYTHSKASVQTKITDYCKAKRLIISCGPDYSANHRFLKEHQCGVCIETNEPSKIAEALLPIVADIENYSSFVQNGWNVLQRDFSKGVIHNKIKLFLTAAIDE